MYMYKEDLVLNNLQWSICHKIKPNQTEPSSSIPALGCALIVVCSGDKISDTS